jgi:hypothetical protein
MAVEANNGGGHPNVPVVIEFIHNVRWTTEKMNESCKVTAECEMTTAEGKCTPTSSVIAEEHEKQQGKRLAFFNLSRKHLGLPKLFRFREIIEETARSPTEKSTALSQWEKLCQEMGLSETCVEYTA